MRLCETAWVCYAQQNCKKGLLYVLLQLLHILSYIEIYIQWCRKGMDQELKVLHKNPETSYVDEGFSGI